LQSKTLSDVFVESIARRFPVAPPLPAKRSKQWRASSSFFGTTDGHTSRVAEKVAHELRDLGRTVDVVDLREKKPVSFDGVDAAILAGSLRVGRFQRELVEFAHDNADLLARLPNAFLAVSLTAAHDSPSAHRELAKPLARFSAETRWVPKETLHVAGALLYTRYGFFTRLVMRFISKRAGGDTDTSREYEYTDWAALAAFASRFDRELRTQVQRSA
jgi:menaquinone-dependent protoporphyrinogen oxidase